MKEQVGKLENILAYDVLDEAMDVSAVQEQDENNGSRSFLWRNKMEKLLLLEGKLFFSKRLVHPEIDDVADRVQSTVMKKNNMERLTTITFLEFKGLADAAAVSNCKFHFDSSWAKKEIMSKKAPNHSESCFMGF
ncbi:hypothetical protein CAEBREN_16854 [Caenorhabditis brenneri]|uniref:Uncharacterized protein n=1 Tax=Caenorhabditis brenneri TaxID=135651 RepID=G0PMG8_CAEBE|nr:hypothetical protein CAEBREN_16854 [Caenorhabditis brenneri]